MRQVSLSSFLFSSSRSFAFISFHILPSIPAYDSLRYLLAFAFSSAQPTLEPRSSLTRGKTNFKNQPSSPPSSPPSLSYEFQIFIYISDLFANFSHFSCITIKNRSCFKRFLVSNHFFFFFSKFKLRIQSPLVRDNSTLIIK